MDNKDTQCRIRRTGPGLDGPPLFRRTMLGATWHTGTLSGRHKSSSHGCRSSHPGCAKAASAIQGLAWAEYHRFVISMLCYIPGELAVFNIGGCESEDAYTETLNPAGCVLAYRVLAWRHIAVSPWLQERSPRMRRSGIDDTGPGPGGAPTASSDCKARSPVWRCICCEGGVLGWMF